MIPKIKSIQPREDFVLLVTFDDGKRVLYDVKEDMDSLPGYSALRDTAGLFLQARLDPSRSCVSWSEDVDLPSDCLYEYGVEIP